MTQTRARAGPGENLRRDDDSPVPLASQFQIWDSDLGLFYQKPTSFLCGYKLLSHHQTLNQGFPP